jgi:hypothetical protein
VFGVAANNSIVLIFGNKRYQQVSRFTSTEVGLHTIEYLKRGNMFMVQEGIRRRQGEYMENFKKNPQREGGQAAKRFHNFWKASLCSVSLLQHNLSTSGYENTSAIGLLGERRVQTLMLVRR